MASGLGRLGLEGAAEATARWPTEPSPRSTTRSSPGDLAPGERLPIEELGVALGMSAMPIREALRRLDAAGLVENIPHRGARVTELSIADLAEVYEARLALEPLAVRRAAERFNAEQAAVADGGSRRSTGSPTTTRRDLGGAHRIPLRALRRGRVDLARAADPAAVGDEPALPARGACRASSTPAAPSTRRSCRPASTTTPTSRRVAAQPSDHDRELVAVAMGGEPLFAPVSAPSDGS